MVEIVRGDYAILEWQVTEARDADGNLLQDLAGIPFKAQARWAPDDPTVLFEKSTANGGITVSGMTVQVRLLPSDTASMVAPCVFVLDLQATVGTNTVTVVTAQGQPLRVRVLPDVTR
jgi:hypothetical protein